MVLEAHSFLLSSSSALLQVTGCELAVAAVAFQQQGAVMVPSCLPLAGEAMVTAFGKPGVVVSWERDGWA